MFFRYATLFVLTTLVLCLTTELFGPARGWLAKSLISDQSAQVSPDEDDEKEEVEKVEEELNETEGNDDDGDAGDEGADQLSLQGGTLMFEGEVLPEGQEVGKIVEQESSKTADQRMFEKLREQYLEEIEPYERGETIEVKLRGRRSTQKYVFLKGMDATVSLGVKQGKITLPMTRFDLSDSPRLFPKRTAHYRALKEMSRLKENGELPSQQREAAFGDTETEVATFTVGDAPGARPGKPGAFSGNYEVQPPETTEGLKELLLHFGKWCQQQNKNMGGRIMKKAYGKRNGECAVLYMVVGPDYRSEHAEWRLEFAEALWSAWAFNTKESGAVRELRDAHLVIVDDQFEMIGGSQPNNAADIWVRPDE